MFEPTIDGIISNFLSILLGWYGKSWISKLKAFYIIRKAKQTKIQNYRESEKWLLNYYNIANENNLFLSCNNEKIAFISREEWQYPQISDYRFNLHVHSPDIKKCEAPYDKKIIKQREMLGDNIWDGELLFLDKLNVDSEEITINATCGTYYQYIVCISKLAIELNACSSSKRKKTVLRDLNASNIADFEQGKLMAQAISCTVSTLFKRGNKYKLLLQKRSSQVPSAAEMCAVVPTFALELNQDYKIHKSQHFCDLKDLLFNNFLREIAVELYGNVDATHNNNRLVPLWYLQLPEMQPWIILRDSGKLIFDILGFGFDLFTGELCIACSAVINDDFFCEQELPKMKSNWEITDKYFVDIQEDKDLSPYKIYPSSSFNVTCLRKMLNDKFNTGPETPHRKRRVRHAS